MSTAMADCCPFRAVSFERKRVVPMIRQVDAGILNIGYAEAGPPDGPPVILLHGWPYDINTYVDVAPLLASAGYRAI
jgi:hypothetical protein